MGFAHVRVLVCNPAQEERCQEMELPADTGAMLSVIPGSVFAQLGIPSLGRRSFRGFGGVIERESRYCDRQIP